MYINDSHTHTKFSFDSNESLENMCEAAIAKGINELAFTDHYDIDDVLEGIYPPYEADEACEAISSVREKYRGKLRVTYGIEIGQPQTYQKEAADFIEKYKFEYVLVSLHNLKDVPDFSMLLFDKMTDRHIEVLWERSLKELDEILDFEYINSLAHITYPYRYVKRYNRSLDLKEYYATFEKLFNKMIKRGICLEVNTSGLRQGVGATLPDFDIVKFYRECGGELITCGSDAHFAKDVGSDIEYTYAKLKEIGFRNISVFHDGQHDLYKL